MKTKHAARIAAIALALAPLASSFAAGSPLVALHGAAMHRAGEGAFRQIREGMTAGDVLAALGEPGSRMRFPLSKTTAWDYEFRDAWGYDSEFSVIVNDAGIVVGTFAARHGGN
jgi:outer membrane protein assembly factor BamE (lipoprotein component of BamABCDE complex)